MERKNLQNTLCFALLLAFENNGLDLAKLAHSGYKMSFSYQYQFAYSGAIFRINKAPFM